MKTIAALLTSFVLSFNAVSQSDPGCADFTVQSISIAPLISQMNITIKNNCANCASGLNGCVYWEMIVIRTIAPFDTIASSSCYCFQTPNNNSVKNYSFLTSASVLPPLNELRVSFMCGPLVGCDTVPFSSALLLSSVQKESALSILPNPIKDYVSIQLTENDVNLEVRDVIGKICISKKVDASKSIIDFSALGHGIYFIQVKDRKDQIVRQFKVIKE
jgi:hypothetical protein